MSNAPHQQSKPYIDAEDANKANLDRAVDAAIVDSAISQDALLTPSNLLTRICAAAIAVALVFGAIFGILFQIYHRADYGEGLRQSIVVAVCYVIALVLARRVNKSTAVTIGVATTLLTSLLIATISISAMSIAVLMVVAAIAVAMPYLSRRSLRHLTVWATMTVGIIGAIHAFGPIIPKWTAAPDTLPSLDQGFLGRVFLSTAIVAVFTIVSQLLLLSHRWQVSLVQGLDHANTRLRTANSNLEGNVARRTEELTRANTLLAQEVVDRQQAEVNLRLFNSVVQHASDGILITNNSSDASGLHIVYVNEAFSQMCGYTTSELVGKSPSLLQGPKTDRTVVDGIMRRLEAGQPTSAEIVYQRKDGSEYWVQLTLSPVRNAAARIDYWVGLMRDVTQRKREDVILRRQNGFLAALHNMTVGLINRFEVEHMFDAVVEQVCKLLNCQHGYIALVSDDGTQLVTSASHGDILLNALPETEAEVVDAPRRKGEGLSGKVWDTGEPIWLSNYGEWHGHVPDLPLPYPVAVAPLKSEDRVVGVIGMVRTDPSVPFEQDEIDLLLRFGQLAALIYDNTQLHQALKRELTERSRIEHQLRTQNGYLDALHDTTLGLIDGLDVQELLRSVLGQASTLLNAPNAFLDLVDENKGVLTNFAHAGSFASNVVDLKRKSQGISGVVWETGQSVVVDDYDHWESRLAELPKGNMAAAMGVPLKSSGQVVGVLGLYRSKHGGTFTAEEVKLLDRLAQLASVAYDNARLYEGAQRELADRKRAEEVLRRQTEYLGALNDTTLGVINRLDMDELLQAVMTRAAALLNVQHSFLDLFDEDSVQTRNSATMGIFASNTPRVFSKGEGLTGQVWLTGETIVIDDYDTWPGRSTQVPAHYACACVGVPLRSGGRIVGCIGMVRTTHDRSFTHDEVSTIQRFAQLASVAYDNAQLYEALRANEQALESRVTDRTRELTLALEENETLRAKSAQAAAAAERSRLARELHDSVSQAIYGIALGARTMQQLSIVHPEKLTEPLNYIVSLADAALAEIRALIFELRPESLEQEGILAALRKQADALRVRYDLAMTLDLPEREPNVSFDVKEALYRIALEATHNTVKHANATQVTIRLVEDEHTICLTVADDGKGFEPLLVGGGHLGLKTMQERVEALHGQLTVHSARVLPDRGTTVCLTLPRQARVSGIGQASGAE